MGGRIIDELAAIKQRSCYALGPGYSILFSFYSIHVSQPLWTGHRPGHVPRFNVAMSTFRPASAAVPSHVLLSIVLLSIMDGTMKI